MRLESPSYLRYCSTHGLSYTSFNQRLSNAVADFRFLVTEDMEEVSYKLRCKRAGKSGIPFYVSIEGCPPSFELCPEYYEIKLEQEL